MPGLLFEAQGSHLEEWMRQGLGRSWSPSRVPLTQGSHEADGLHRGVGNKLGKGGGSELRKAPPQLPCSVQTLRPAVGCGAAQHSTHLVHLINLQAPCMVRLIKWLASIEVTALQDEAILSTRVARRVKKDCEVWGQSAGSICKHHASSDSSRGCRFNLQAQCMFRLSIG